MKRLIIALVVATAACGKSGPVEEPIINARPMEASAAEPPVAWGDCAEANRRAAAKPDLTVDSLPRPVYQRPAPFARMPYSVKRELDAKGSSIKVHVIVDTLGRPDMKTFEVIESSHPWLAESLKRSVPSWRFRAARLSGCKVARIYKFSATSKPRR